MHENTDKLNDKVKQKITQLTPEQNAKMADYVSKWIKIGNDTARLNEERTLEIIADVQRFILGKAPTPVVIVNNPIEAWVACNYAMHGHMASELKDCVNEFFTGKKPSWKLVPYVSPYLNGAFSAPTFAIYDFIRYELGAKFEAQNTPVADAPASSRSVEELYDIWRSTTELGLIYPIYDVQGTKQDMCIVTEKPLSVKLNENNVIHCDGGPSIEYAGHGNIKIYALNGVTVPEWLACTPSHKIDIERIHEIQNADVKAEFVRKIGIERLLSMGVKIDTHTNYNDDWYTKSEYELWDMSSLFQGIDYAPHLKMLNQTTKIWHVEAVSPSCRTITDALKDRYGRNVEIKGIA